MIISSTNIILIFMTSILPTVSIRCVRQLSTCACETDESGMVLNFTALNAGGLNQTRFSINDSSSPPRVFSYNPCSPIYCANEKTAALCMKDAQFREFIIGAESSASFISTPDPLNILLRYTFNVTRYISDVYYECSPNEVGKFSLMENKRNESYSGFLVATRLACVNYSRTTLEPSSPMSSPLNSYSSTPVSSTTPSSSPLQSSTTPHTSAPHTSAPPPPNAPSASVGSILVLGAALGFLVYLACGTALNACMRRAERGVELVQMIPHASFWREFFAYVADGCFFTYNYLAFLLHLHPDVRDYSRF